MRHTKTFPSLLILFSLSLSSFAQQREIVKKQRTMSTEKATFGSGCFWCTEAIFQQVKGVHTAQSGYMGGKTQNPTYKDVCTGLTGHAEVVQIVFNPEVVSFDELLEIFWKTHDPTTLNRQGNDVGTQYRSAVFYHTDEQKNKAEAYKFKLDNAKIWDNPIVTEITPASQFYIAEDYHQDYYNNNANKNPYCSMVITPKIEKFKKVFEDKLAK
jgi:peptide-methionine (S)-S-oxide reductase